MPFYKVVRKDYGRYYSSTVSSKLLQVEYKIDEWVYPTLEGTKLFVYKLPCIDFLCGRGESESIFEVEVKNPLPLSKYNLTTGKYHLEMYTKEGIPALLKMLKLRKQHKKFTHLTKHLLLDEAAVVDTVKLIRQIRR